MTESDAHVLVYFNEEDLKEEEEDQQETLKINRSYPHPHQRSSRFRLVRDARNPRPQRAGALLLMKVLHRSKGEDPSPIDEQTAFVEYVEEMRRQSEQEKKEKDSGVHLLLRYVGRLVFDTHHYAWITEYQKDSLCLYDYLLSLQKGNGVSLVDPAVVTISVLRQMCVALSFLHQDAQSAHGDLSLSNVLIHFSSEVKHQKEPVRVTLIDWEDGRRHTHCPRYACDTTLLYSPPERLLHEDGEWGWGAVDVWALGVLAYQLCRQDPSVHPLCDTLTEAVESSAFHLISTLRDLKGSPPQVEEGMVADSESERVWACLCEKGGNIPEEALVFISACLTLRPHCRPSVSQLAKSAWLTSPLSP